nr:efflux RND transporter permease subunit [Xanthomonas translucens]
MLRLGEATIQALAEAGAPVGFAATAAMDLAYMMPIALGFSGDSSFRAPMAIAVIGGLITSTLLSLIVIPAAFTVVDDLRE